MSAAESENRNSLVRRVANALGVVFLVAMWAAPMRAQDVAEAARQARERKAAQQNSPRHVYTEEDLKRVKILTPEDASRAVASRKVPAPVFDREIEAATAEPENQQERDQETPSLGEIARRYHLAKQARRSVQALKIAPPSRYPLDLPEASLAAPKTIAATSSGSLREDELRPPPPKFPNADPATGNARISPFAPRRDVVARNSLAIAPPASVVASLQRKQVQRGECWWGLARRYLGDGSRWPELLRFNPGAGRDPNRLRAGTFVFVPLRSEMSAGSPGPKIVARTVTPRPD